MGIPLCVCVCVFVCENCAGLIQITRRWIYWTATRAHVQPILIVVSTAYMSSFH